MHGIIGTARELLNLGLLAYGALALALVAFLVVLCVGVALTERRRRSRVTAPAPKRSYGETRRRVLGAR